MKKNRRMYRLFIIIPILFLMTIGFASIVISSDFHGESRFGANAFNAYFDNVYDSFNSSFFVNLFSLSNNNRTLTLTPTFENVSEA